MHEKSWLTSKNIKEFLFMTFGITLVSAGVYFFKFPNHFSIGGVWPLSWQSLSLLPGLRLRSITALSTFFSCYWAFSFWIRALVSAPSTALFSIPWRSSSLNGSGPCRGP